MKLISFACLAAVCLILSVLYAIFGRKKGWQGFFIKTLTLFCILTLSLLANYLRAITDTIGFFITLSCGAFFLSEGVGCFDEENKMWVEKLFAILASGLLLAATVTITQFNVLPLAGGVLLGFGLGFITWAFGKEKTLINSILSIVQLGLIGGVLGFSVLNILYSPHFITSLLTLAGAALILISTVMRGFNRDSKALNIIANIMFSIGLTLIAGSTYFY